MGTRMPLRTISLGLIATSDPDPAAAVRYALDLAGRSRAHLLARIGAPPLVIPPYPIASPMGNAIERENIARKAQAEQMALMIHTEAERLGAIASAEVLSSAYDPLARHLMRMARVSDVCIALAPPSTEPQQRDILIDMLFGSGVPLLLVPANRQRIAGRRTRRRRHVVRTRHIDAGGPDGHGRLWALPVARVYLGRCDARYACADRYSHAAIALRRRRSRRHPRLRKVLDGPTA